MTGPRADHPRTDHRRPDIQGLRALAVIVVIAFHAGLPVPGGFVGVDVFFVISGFVITAMLMREWAASGRLAWGTFYLRRFRRLTPALALMVSVTMVASAFLLSPLGPQETAAQTGIGAMLLVANAVIAATTGGYFDARAELNPLLNTWSLSVEEQFYLVFPALLALGWILGRRRGGQIPALVIVSTVALASFALTLIPSESAWVGFYSPLTRAWEFAIGALLALAALRVASRAAATAIAVLGLAAVLASLWLIDGEAAFPGPWTLLPTVGTALLILAGSHPDNPVSRALGWRPVVAVGDASYSLYLWHWPVIVFAVALWPELPWVPVVAALASCIPAILSYRYVEQPLRSSRSHPALLVTMTLIPPLALAGGLWWAAAQGMWSPRVQAYKEVVQSEGVAVQLGCDLGIPAGEAPSQCTWLPDAPGKPIVLLGDSNAAHFGEALISASEALDRPLTIATNTGCPMIDVRFTQSAFNVEDRRTCRAYVSRTLDWLDSQPPSTVILSASDRIWEGASYAFEPGEVRGGTPEAYALLEEALESTVRRIEAAGHEVVLVQTVPQWGTVAGKAHRPYVWDPLDCTTFDILASRCQQSMPLSAALDQHSASRAALTAVAERTGATVLDLFERVCRAEVCSTLQDDVLIYRDPTHISPGFSLMLTPEFIAVLEGRSVTG
ncbi:MAG: hypothetical protein RL134_1216 [Actinomycetota bacterium]